MVRFFFQAEDGIRDYKVTGVQTCALPICMRCLLCRRRRLGRANAVACPVTAAIAWQHKGQPRAEQATKVAIIASMFTPSLVKTPLPQAAATMASAHPAVTPMAFVQAIMLAYERRGISALSALEKAQIAPDSVKDRKSTRLNSSHLVISYAVF